MPDVVDVLDKLSAASYFSALDLKAGFHNIPISEESQKYTMFITQDGLYYWKRMPFGLRNAPAHFQKTILAIVEVAPYLHVVVYLDDIVVYGKDPEDVWE